MLRTRCALLLLSLLVAACGGAGSEDVSLPLTEYAQTGWEEAFADHEMTTWREGVIRRMQDTPSAEPEDHPPLAGAVVELFAPHPTGRRPLVKLAETVSGPDGRFRVGPGPASGWMLCVRDGDSVATYAGHAPRMTGIFPLPEGETDVLVRNGYPMDVQVVDESGQPVPGARLLASGFGYEEPAVADADGVAHFRAPRGVQQVEAVDPHRRGAKSEFSAPLAASDAPYRLVARDRGPVKGWVVDAETGTPLRGAVVMHVSSPDLHTTTDADGRFALDAPHEGRIAAFGRERAWRSYAIPSAGEVELRLSRATPRRGRVVDLDGRGVLGARLVASVPTSRGRLETVTGPVSGADGQFEFSWMPRPPRGADAVVHVVARHRGLGASAVLAPAEVEGDLELRLLGERTLRGSISRAGGAPCARTAVTIEAEEEDVRADAAHALGTSHFVVCKTRADGSFEASGLPRHVPLALRFTIDTVRVVRRIPPGGDVQEDIVLDRGRSISGRVVDVDGQPVTLGGEIRAELTNHPEFETLTRVTNLRPDGTFTIEDLPDGTYGVRAKVPSFDVSGAVTTAGGADVRLIAERPAELLFEIVFPDGAEPEPVQVQLLDADDPAVPPRTVSIRPDVEGARGRLALVRRGNYHIVAAGGAWRCRMRDVTIADGKRPPLSLAMEKTLVRSIVLTDVDGRPLSGRRVIVAPVGKRGITPELFHTGVDGSVEIAGLADGDWVARVVDPGRPPIAHRFTISAVDEASEIRLRVAAHGTLEIAVDHESPDGFDAAIVSLELGDGSALVAWGPGANELASRWRLPEDGKIELRGVLVGRVTVVLTSPAGARTRREVDVTSGEVIHVRVP